jgi:hypothetical protein
MRRSRTESEVADLIERFLDGRSAYPQEWNDFVECSEPDPMLDVYRRKCYELDPEVNRPEPADEQAVEELRQMIEQLRGAQR